MDNMSKFKLKSFNCLAHKVSHIYAHRFFLLHRLLSFINKKKATLDADLINTNYIKGKLYQTFLKFVVIKN